ncbi:unnamed protein product [Oikopleura dioica]|uniref:Uncharacterized protein n=1 Tax=Oikopleura dioica TaxID=34765 RepID=E4XT77_OIKDI|nr:unnamed protein product [Oikopleura dioica]CBY39376.1 unnamed protein product [Oikopleura dioica]
MAYSEVFKHFNYSQTWRRESHHAFDIFFWVIILLWSFQVLNKSQKQPKHLFFTNTSGVIGCEIRDITLSNPSNPSFINNSLALQEDFWILRVDIFVFPLEVRGLLLQIRNQQGEAVGRFDWDPRFSTPQWLQNQRDATFFFLDCNNQNDTIMYLGYQLIESTQTGFILPVWYREDPNITLSDLSVEFTILSTKDAYFSSIPFSLAIQTGITNQECLDQGLSPLSAEIILPETTTTNSTSEETTTGQLFTTSSAQLISETTNAAISQNTTNALVTAPFELTTVVVTTEYSNTTSSFLRDKLSPSMWELWVPLLIFFIPLSCFLLWVFFREKKRQDNEVHPEE